MHRLDFKEALLRMTPMDAMPRNDWTTVLPGQDEEARLLADLGMRPMQAERQVSLAE